MRVWVLLDAKRNLYVYRENVCRMCTEEYKKDDLSNQYMHLSNHCLQTDHPNYSKLVSGNEMFFTEFETYLKENTEYELDRDLRPQINEIIIHTIKTVQHVRIYVQLPLSSLSLAFSLSPSPFLSSCPSPSPTCLPFNSASD